MGEWLHVGMDPESGAGAPLRSLDESREELLERIDIHPMLEHLQLLMKLPTDLNRCCHSGYSKCHGAINRVAIGTWAEPPTRQARGTIGIYAHTVASGVIISTTVQEELSLPRQ